MNDSTQTETFRPSEGSANFAQSEDENMDTFARFDAPQPPPVHLMGETLGELAPKKGAARVLEIALIVLFSILLLVLALGISLSFVASEPVNRALIDYVQTDADGDQLQAFQNISRETLHFVLVLPFETAREMRIDMNDVELIGADYYSDNEISHLVDVRVIFGWAILLTFVLLPLSAIAITLARDKLITRKTLLSAGILTIVFPVLLGAIMLLAFGPFFIYLHELFFPQGNWQFYSGSLLIRTFPELYWQGAGVVWMLFLLLVGFIFILLSRFSGKKRPKHVHKS
jgi:integral membrane protein (TIGR01906 family)